MLKIFLTGDNHIGLKYMGHGAAGTVLAQKRMDAFHSMVQIANEEECGLFVIAGDLFENTRITKKEMQPLLETLSRFHGTVTVLPGNHDYYEKDSKLWEYFRDIAAEKGNILLLNQYEPRPISVNGENVVLYPAPCMSKHSAPGENNLGWIQDLQIVPDDTYRIGIAHGAVEGETIDNEGAYFLMSRQELESIPVDAWLIGHTHVPFPKNVAGDYADCGKIFNAGTHVQTDVNCRTEGLCFIIQIAEDKRVQAKKVVTGNVRFYREELDLSAGEMERKLDYFLNKIGDDSVVDLILSGVVDVDEYAARQSIVEGKLSRFIEGTYRDAGLSRLITRDLIAAEFPETSFSAKFLSALIDEPKEAQLAYDLLNGLREAK
jgi:predicted phosphodiesterase